MKLFNTALKRKIIGLTVGIALLISFVLSVGDGVYLPNWNSVYSIFKLAPELGERDFVRFIDVDQGDCILIYSNNKVALIDTGPEESARKLVKKLDRYGIKKIDYLFFSHIHNDHVGGTEILLENFEVGELIMPNILDNPEGAQIANSSAAYISHNGGLVKTAYKGMEIELGDFDIEVLAYYPEMEEENDRSVIMMISKNLVDFLFVGDAEGNAEKQILKDYVKINCEVLKVGHHGSSTSTTKEFLERCTPDDAVISCGYNNFYMHPHDETIGRLEKAHIKFYRTDYQGDITFEVADESYEVSFDDSWKS